MNVLITSVSRKVSLIRAFQRALRLQGGGKVVAVDADPASAALYVADDFAIVPPGDGEGSLARIRALCVEKEIELVVPTRDEELPMFAKERGSFAEMGVRVMVSAPESIERCQDKRAFVAFCLERGFRVPKTHDPVSALPFPLFVRPSRGKGGALARRVDSPEALRLALSSVTEPLVQEFIAAPEYSVDVFADFEGRVLSAVPRIRRRVVAGESYVTETVQNPALVAEAVALTAALGLVGQATLQCFVRGDGVLFIEANPRFGGATHLSIAAGAPSPAWLVRLVRGETLPVRVGDFEAGLLMLRYTEDLFLKAGRPAAREFA